jgi:flagellar protein FliS
MTVEALRAYVAAELQTAPPQRLRLMLIDAAIGFVAAAQEHAQTSHWAVAGESFVQARRAVIELLAGIKDDRDDASGAEAALAQKIRGLYVFLFRVLSEAQLYRDPRRLDDAMRLLAMERETWRQVCDCAGGDDPAPAAAMDLPAGFSCDA